jgi:hypothetical protein
MIKIVFTLCLLATPFSRSIAQSEFTTEERKEVKESVKKQSQAFWDLATHDYNDENYKRLVGLLVESDDEAWLGKPAFWIRNDEIYYVKDEIEEGFEMAFANRISTPTKIKENYYAVIAADVVIEVMTQDYYIISDSGNRSPDFRASFTIVWVLKEDQWKIIHLHKSQFDKE